MSIGLLAVGNHPVDRMADLAGTAEANGYDVAWLADERFYRQVHSRLN